MILSVYILAEASQWNNKLA